MNDQRIFVDAAFLDGLITVSKHLHVTMSEDAIIDLFSGVFEKVMPGRLVCIRTVRGSSALNLVYANGKLRADRRDVFGVAAGATEGLKLLPEEEAHIFASPLIQQTAEYAPLFENAHTGVSLLLCDRIQLYGALTIEYPTVQDAFSLEADRQMVLPFVHHLVAALRNAQLMTETLRLKEYWAKLFDNANAPVVVVDREQRITMMNRAFADMVGLDRDAFTGEDFLSLIPSDNRARLLPFIINAIRGEPSANIEMCFPVHNSEDVAYIAFNAAPLRDENNAVAGVILVGQDLTMVRELQRQVIHTEKLATLGQVAAGVAHELNNPLTSIMVYSSYLSSKLAGTLEAEDLKKLTRIHGGAKRIQKFTRDLVTYARPSDEPPELVDIVKTLEHAISFCEHTLHSAHANMVLSLADDIRPVYGVPSQFEQVFVNLIANACHALPSTGGDIPITAVQADAQRASITIADSGGGISTTHLQRVFEPFYTTKEIGKGTGLGLPIVRNILKNHNATIAVTSEPQRGTSFVIVLPTT